MVGRSIETAEFARVAILNESTKQVLMRSFEVSLRALDAIVQSKRGGGALRGFDEVSSQMRVWSRELHGKLIHLSELSRSAVREVSEYAKSVRQQRLLVGCQSTRAQDAVALARRDAEKAERRLRDRWRGIALELDDLRQMGMMACVLSRSAMIEASSASDEQRDSLMNVSREFYDNAEDVLAILQEVIRKTGQAQT